jgi:hypothetical protein
MIPPDEPFQTQIRPRWIPLEMLHPPALDPAEGCREPERYYALLINPFYPKDAHASFGKHVLTPTLALTSFAATTPEPWRVEYWDENLLHGRPPCDPMTELCKDAMWQPMKMTIATIRPRGAQSCLAEVF